MSSKPIAVIGNLQSVSYSQLSDVVSFTAKHYGKNGINSGDKVVILAENSIEYVIAIFSLWKLGAIPVPINIYLNDKEIERIISHSECKFLLYDLDERKKRGIANLKMTIRYNGEKHSEEKTLNPNDIAVIIHTSGSSGVPKGVITTSKNLYSSYISSSRIFGFSSNDVFLASLPFYHIGGFAIINRMLLSGGTLVIPKSLKKNDLSEAINLHAPTVVSLVPTMLKRLIEDRIKPNKELRYLFLGGGPSDNNLIQSALSKNWPIVKVYGSSETTAMVTANMRDNLKVHPESAGKAFPGVEIKILDKSLKEAKEKSVGEIAVKGEMIAAGYLNAENIWRSKLHNGFYLTGDYGYIDADKNVFVVARRTDLIVSGGENIVPQEIENEILKHPKILDVKVVGVKDNEWGEAVSAAIVLRNNEVLDKNELKQFLKNRIASYKIPKKIIFLEKLPKTELGKVEVVKLKEFFFRV